MTKIRLRINKIFLLKSVVSGSSMASNIKLTGIGMKIRKQKNKEN